MDATNLDTLEASIEEASFSEPIPNDPPPPLPIEPPSVRVSITKRTDAGGYAINCLVNGTPVEVPAPEQVAPYMSVAHQRIIKRNWAGDIGYALIRPNFRAITLQNWADAIGAFLMSVEARKAGASYESRSLDSDAFLAVGDTLYRLSPVEAIRTNKALAATKKRIQLKTKDEASRILQEAKVAGDALITESKRKFDEAKNYLANAQRSTPPPQLAYAHGIVCRWRRFQWELQMPLKIRLSGFDTNFIRATDNSTQTRSWDALPESPIVRTAIWIPVSPNGEYSVTSVKIVDGFPLLPHISTDHGCMAIGDAPSTLLTLTDWENLQRCLKRVMSRVQLDSQLVLYANWREPFLPAIPPELDYALYNEGLVSATYARRLDSAELAAAAAQPPTQPITTEGVTDEWTVPL